MPKRDDPNQEPLLPHLRVRLEHSGTKASYEADLADFNRFSIASNKGDLPKPPVPPNLLAGYVTDLHKRGFRRETVRRRLCAIAAWYKENDVESDPRKNDKVRRAWDEIKKDEDRKKERRLAALQSVVFEMLDSLDADEQYQGTLAYLPPGAFPKVAGHEPVGSVAAAHARLCTRRCSRWHRASSRQTYRQRAHLGHSAYLRRLSVRQDSNDVPIRISKSRRHAR
jgi:hypothetical protein